MRRNYYYLVASLPELLLDQERKEFNINTLRTEVKECVLPADYKLVEMLFWPFDNENFLNVLLNRQLQPNQLGNINPSTFDNIAENLHLMPRYMQDFYREHTQNANANHDDYIDPHDTDNAKPVEVIFQEKFYKTVLNTKNTFLKKWFAFARDFSNILTALNCRRLDIDIAKQIVGQGFIVDALTRSQAPDFGLKQEVDYIDKIIQIADIQDVIERERKFDIMKWDMANELTTWDYFNINFVLAFFVKASIIQRWNTLDVNFGNKMFNQLFSDLKASFNVDNAFQPQT